MTDTLARSIVKTVVWRVIATAITMVVVYLFTGSINQASTITVTVAAILAGGYYLHERVWEKVEWGRRGMAYVKHYSK